MSFHSHETVVKHINDNASLQELRSNLVPDDPDGILLRQLLDADSLGALTRVRDAIAKQHPIAQQSFIFKQFDDCLSSSTLQMEQNIDTKQTDAKEW